MIFSQKVLSATTLVSLLVSVQAFAADQQSFKITGTIPNYVQITKKTHSAGLAANLTDKPTYKQITLERVELSDAALEYLANQTNDTPNQPHFTTALSTLPTSAELGMNGVPVLDQGQHGSCVTFADTAALDAILGHTNYISQLCNLELGYYLEKENAKRGIQYPSGWEGSLNQIVFQQIQDYGIISMQYQNQYGCGSATKSVKTYPLNEPNNMGVPMSDVDFKKHSEMVLKDISWRILLNANNAFSSTSNKEAVLSKVKQAVSKGNRVVFGTLLDINGTLRYKNGAEGSYHNIKNIAWILTPTIQGDLNAKRINAGHAMVITGYDDNAVITGPDGSQHTGVLTLRNSWSSDVGDNGNYYMSYQYFIKLAMEAVEISPTPFNN